MKKLKSSLLFVLFSMFVVFKGHCQSIEAEWIESHHTFAGQTFAISFPFPGIPEVSESLTLWWFGSKKLDITYNPKNGS